jgi:hypothetical protein
MFAVLTSIPLDRGRFDKYMVESHPLYIGEHVYSVCIGKCALCRDSKRLIISFMVSL